MFTQQARLPWHLQTDTWILGTVSGATGAESSHVMLTLHDLHATSQTLALASAVVFHPVFQKLVSLHFYQNLRKCSGLKLSLLQMGKLRFTG